MEGSVRSQPEAIYDQMGQVVGRLWETLIYDARGIRLLARVLDGWVWTIDSQQHIGYAHGGWFTDSAGHPVAFLIGASGGPPLPVLAGPAMDRVNPLPFGSWKPLRQFPATSWSSRSWEAYINATTPGGTAVAHPRD
jgi:hypothetical protein